MYSVGSLRNPHYARDLVARGWRYFAHNGAQKRCWIKEATMKRLYRTLLLSVLCILFAAAPVQAGALWLYEEATPDMGVAGAGRQAAAQDAST
jgi:hypothetical protein